MARTRPDDDTPVRPPADGVRELLFFTALTAAVYVIGALALVVIAAVAGPAG